MLGDDDPPARTRSNFPGRARPFKTNDPTRRSATFPVPPEMATVVAMTSAAYHMPLADVKNRLSEVVDRVEREHREA
jgi:hypothetical protein